MRDHLIDTLEEQVLVQFSGKINVLKESNRQILGSVVLNDGDIYRIDYKGLEGMKALCHLYLDDLKDDEIVLVVEPEMVESIHRNIHYPYKTLIQKLSEFMTEYEKAKSLRPPTGIKLIAMADFLTQGEKINEQEFQVLATISDYNKIEDIYKNCPLMEYEITNCLISLRQKGALKVIKVQA
jgi:hypothetical protein